MPLIVFWCVCGYVLFFSIKSSVIKNYSAIFVASSVITLVFLFGAVGILGIGTKIVIVFGALLLCYSLYLLSAKCFVSNAKTTLTHLLNKTSLGTIVFILVGTLWFFLSKNAVVFGWDEFFWAQFTKALEYSNKFYGPTSAVLQGHVRYPPGMSLFQYMFLTFSQFKPGVLYFASGLIPLAAISMFIDFANRKMISLFIIFAALFFIVPQFYGVPHFSIINDSTIGFLFAVGLCMVTYYKGNMRNLFILMAPVVAFLPLVKETGLILALIIVMVFIVRAIFDLYNRGAYSYIEILRSFLLIILAPLAPFIMRAIWLHHLHVVGVPLTQLNVFRPQILLHLLFNPETTREKFVLAAFLHAIPFKAIGLLKMMSSLLWMLVFSFGFLIPSYYSCSKQSARFYEESSILLICWFGFIVYVSMLLLVYAYVFSQYEGEGLASYSRYLSSFIMGIGFLSVISIVNFLNSDQVERKVKTKGGAIIIFVFVVLMAMGLFYVRRFWINVVDISGFSQKFYTSKISDKIKPYLNVIKKQTKPEDKVWIIQQDSNGIELMLYRYEIAPRIANFWYWFLGNKYSSKDLWTNNLTIKSFSSKLQSYQYLLLSKVDDNFWQHYGTMFKGNLDIDKHSVLFSINKTDKGQVYFKAVPTSGLFNPNNKLKNGA